MEANYFTILYWFCHISTWIHHGCTCVPILNPPPTSLPIPSLWVIPVHQPHAPCIMHRTWTGDSFYIWYYTCFNAILPNHPTLSLSHRVQKPVLYICVSFAVSHTGLSRFPFNRTHVQFNITYAQKNLPEVSGCFLFSPLPSLITKLEILVLFTYSLRNNKIQHALTCSFDIRKNNQLKLLSGLYTT